MIQIILSELDFDYEIQALVNSFFPGQQSRVSVRNENDREQEEYGCLDIYIEMGQKEIQMHLETLKGQVSRSVSVTGEQDFHKHKDKTTHPYRSYYKNQLKRTLFEMLRDLDSTLLDMERSVPQWGTMTGVRPTKIAMNEILTGSSRESVYQELKKEYCCSEEKAELCLDIATREAELLKKADFENGYSLYVGIPFCPTTCLYCSFTSYPMERFAQMIPDYLSALKKEIAYSATLLPDRKLSSVYIGGGTPTTLSAKQLQELVEWIQEKFPTEQAYEFTVEAGRPDSITREKLEALWRAGVRRISVNPQTMQQKTLDLIGRRHTVQQTVDIFQMAREIGFDNINMDLIIGLPGETEEDFEDTLAQVQKLDPDSLTIHSLVVKRASRLRTVMEECGTEDQRADYMEKMLAMGEAYAREQGYNPYYMYRQKNSAGHAGSSGQENIGYSKPGKECLYNILIMEEKQTIVAVGAGASTKKYDRDKKIVSRVENVKSITDYIARIDEMMERKNFLL